MATKWINDNILNLDLSYLIFRDKSEGGGNLSGKINFSIGCKKLENGKFRCSVKEYSNAFKNKCGLLLKNLVKRHKLNKALLLDIISHEMRYHNVDIDSIEPYDFRIKRLVKQEEENKNFFEKISEKV